MHWYCAIVTAICATIGITSLAITVRHVFESSFAEEAARMRPIKCGYVSEQQQMKQINMPTLPHYVYHIYMETPCEQLDLCAKEFGDAGCHNCHNCCRCNGALSGWCKGTECICDLDGGLMQPPSVGNYTCNWDSRMMQV